MDQHLCAGKKDDLALFLNAKILFEFYFLMWMKFSSGLNNYLRFLTH